MKKLGFILVFFLTLIILNNLAYALTLQDLVDYFISIFTGGGGGIRGGIVGDVQCTCSASKCSGVACDPGYKDKSCSSDEDCELSTSEVKIGDYFNITIACNPSTGYNWWIKSIDSNLLQSTKNDTTNCSPLIGGGCDCFFEFKALKEGTTTVKFLYYQLWKGEESFIDSYEKTVKITSTTTTCKNLCGDGICQEVVCQAIGCPCAETSTSCPEDCALSSCVYGTVNSTTSVNYNNYKFYVVQGATAGGGSATGWAKIIVKDQSDNTVETIIVDNGNSKDTTKTSPILTLWVSAVRALQDGTVIGVDLAVGPTGTSCPSKCGDGICQSWESSSTCCDDCGCASGKCLSSNSGEANATYGVQLGNYIVYVLRGSNNEWVEVSVTQGGEEIEKMIIVQGTTKNINKAPLVVKVNSVKALQDGTVLGAELLVSTSDGKGKCTGPICTDSDGGSNYYTKGTVTLWDLNNKKSYTDYCGDTNSLYEYTCLINPEHQTVDNAYSIEHKICPNGCKDGACIQTNQTQKSINVISPNGGEQWETGKTYNIKWQSTGIPSDANISIQLSYILVNKSSPYESHIFPIGTNFVNNTGNYNWTIPKDNFAIYTPWSNIQSNKYLIRVIYSSPITGKVEAEDYSDNYFSIISTTPTCTDSDGGKDYYVKGTASIGSLSYTDQCNYCTGACIEGRPCPPVVCGAVEEYYCFDNGISSETFVCPGGCKDGACVEEIMSCEKECEKLGYKYGTCSYSYRCESGFTDIGEDSCPRPVYGTDKEMMPCMKDVVGCVIQEPHCCCSYKENCPYQCCENDPDYLDKNCPQIRTCACEICLVGEETCPPCKCPEPVEYVCQNHLCIARNTYKIKLKFHPGWNMFSIPVKIGYTTTTTTAVQATETLITKTTVTTTTTTTTPQPQCTTGTYRCVGKNLERCTNGQWQFTQSCAYACLNDRCVEQTTTTTGGGGGVIAERLCSEDNFASKIWHYENGKYVETYSIEPGEGYWIKMKNDCVAYVEGEPVNLDDFPALNAGWNQIGAPAEQFEFSNVGGDCKFNSGPWSYNVLTKQYEKAAYLVPGEGYWVNVESSCKLGPEQPPVPPTLGSLLGNIFEKIFDLIMGRQIEETGELLPPTLPG